ncbi:MAG: isocitrate/isopropylmalate dehydrogenase family protein [Candidatus Bathyarchaeota archaeon]|nr:isocitrate/isopropylmalate dehydrogenase family protein [Candidatus Bathyarchaeota archaeon]
MSKYKISLIPGDGIGPELSEATMEILNAVQKRFDIELEVIEVEAGDTCFEKTGVALPEETVEVIRNSHACMKGPVGETAADVIVKLRIMFDLYANLRPIKTYPPIPSLKPDIDMMFVRENTEDVYRGIEFETAEGAFCIRVITKKNSERIAKKAFETARRRNGKKRVTAIHKANVMKKTCGLFAQTCRDVAKQYPDIKFDELYVDAASMRLIKEPETFDVFVTPNMFGDILSDEAAQLIGGLGMAPGANVGDDFALFEPIHGSAPNRAGKQTANPCSMILSAKLMFDWLGEKYDDPECFKAADAIENAVATTLRKGITLPDFGGTAKTLEMAQAMAKEIINSK